MVLVLWYGGQLTLRGDIDPGQLTSFLLYTVFIAVALGGAAASTTPARILPRHTLSFSSLPNVAV